MAIEVTCGHCHGSLLIEDPNVVVACPHCSTHLSFATEEDGEAVVAQVAEDSVQAGTATEQVATVPAEIAHSNDQAEDSSTEGAESSADDAFGSFSTNESDQAGDEATMVSENSNLEFSLDTEDDGEGNSILDDDGETESNDFDHFQFGDAPDDSAEEPNFFAAASGSTEEEQQAAPVDSANEVTQQMQSPLEAEEGLPSILAECFGRRPHNRR